MSSAFFSIAAPSSFISLMSASGRTPGFSTYNPFVWPVRDGMPLAFLGFGEDDNLSRLPQVQAAIAALAKEMGGEVAPNYAMIFKTLHGDDYVATLDLD